MKAVPTNPADKIKMMKASLHCLILGLFALLPVIGLPFAIAAGWVSGRARAKEKYYWNPARPQRILGFACAVFGAFIWGWVDILLIYRSINIYISS